MLKLNEGVPGSGNSGVVAGVLATIGELARVVCDYLLQTECKNGI